MVGLIVEEMSSLLAVGEHHAGPRRGQAGHRWGVIRLTHPNRESVAKVADDIRTAAATGRRAAGRDDQRRSASPT